MTASGKSLSGKHDGAFFCCSFTKDSIAAHIKFSKTPLEKFVALIGDCCTFIVLWI